MPKYAPTKPKISASQTSKGRTEEDAPLTRINDGSGLNDIADVVVVGMADVDSPMLSPVKFNPFGYKNFKVG